jgi:glycosyltransferase involved in cell wall biosynthesis
MDILVHASFREGLARALPQALIAGKSVVSYDIDGAREVAINDQTGYLVPPSWEALVDPLTKLVASRELRSRLGQAGRDHFTEQFRHEFMTRRIRELYQRVLDANSVRACEPKSTA